MKKFTLLISIFAVFMIMAVVTTSGTTLTKASFTTTTATVLPTNDTALMACCATTPEIVKVAQMNVAVNLKEKEVAEKKIDLAMFGMVKQSTTDMIATTLTAGTNDAKKLNANTEASAMWVSNSSALTNNILTVAMTSTGKAAAVNNSQDT